MIPYFRGPWNEWPHNSAHLRTLREVFPGKLCLFDLGAAGGTPPPFLFLKEEVDIVNFEPDKRAHTEGNRKTYPVAIGPAELKKIYLNRRPTTSSLLPANKRITDRYDWSHQFKTSDDIFETLAIETVETSPLDAAVTRFNLPPPDFLKIDVQGLSLEALQGAAGTIERSVLGIEIEVELLESYAGQKTFGAVHEHLYREGFEIFRLKNLNKWYYKTAFELKLTTGQDVFCDLIYFRALDSIQEQPAFWIAERAMRHLQLLLLYDLTDTAAAFLQEFRRHQVLSCAAADPVQQFISAWPGALEFFYLRPSRSKLERFLSLNPRRVIRKVQSLFQSRAS